LYKHEESSCMKNRAGVSGSGTGMGSTSSNRPHTSPKRQQLEVGSGSSLALGPGSPAIVVSYQICAIKP